MEAFRKEQREKKQLALELKDEAVQKLYAGKLNDAKEIAIRARDLFEDIDENIEVASTLNILAIIYDELGYEQLVLSSFLDALEIALDENAYDLSAKLYNNLASKFMYTKTYDRALYYLQQSLEMLKKGYEADLINEKDKTCFVLILYLNLSLIHCIEGNAQESRYYYEESVKLSTHPRNKKLRLTFECFELLILWKLGEHSSIKEKIDSVLITANEIEYSTNYIESMSYIFEVLKELKDYDRWEKALILMNNHVDGDEGLYVKEEILKYWLQFYKDTDNKEKYTKACVELHELRLEKEVEDNAKHASAIEMETEIRFAAREKKQTDKIVYLDPLTGIGNRNKMLEDSKKYIEDSIREGHSVAIGLIDIDYFKECNDTYGHVEGDECLKKVANIIKDALGDIGFVYRFGGDEFLILIYNLKADEINELGRTIHDNLAKEKIPNIKSPISKYVTISQGYTRAYAEEGDTIEHLINQVDRVLYSVKRFGRNNYKFTDFEEIDI